MTSWGGQASRTARPLTRKCSELTFHRGPAAPTQLPAIPPPRPASRPPREPGSPPGPRSASAVRGAAVAVGQGRFCSSPSGNSGCLAPAASSCFCLCCVVVTAPSPAPRPSPRHLLSLLLRWAGGGGAAAGGGLPASISFALRDNRGCTAPRMPLTFKFSCSVCAIHVLN